MAIADADVGADGLWSGGEGDPVEAGDAEGGFEKGIAGADGDLAGGGVGFDDVEGLAGGDIEAASLADGEVVDAGVFAEFFAGGVDDGAFGGGLGEALFLEVSGDEGGVVAIGDEADFLAVGFFGDGEAEGEGELADFGLDHGAEGEEGAGELGLGEAPEEVGLVFGGVGGAEELVAVEGGVEADLGVVAGGDFIGADAVGHFEELVELDEVIAEGAGDGCFAGDVIGDEGFDDVVLEGLFEVDDVEGDAEGLGDEAGVVDIVEGAAAAGGA